MMQYIQNYSLLLKNDLVGMEAVKWVLKKLLFHVYRSG